MNDEIKEILDNLRIYAGREENGFISDIEDYITNLQEENQKLLKICADYDKGLNDYNSRIDKAVEYINLYAGYDNNFCLDYHELQPLLNILKGGD